MKSVLHISTKDEFIRFASQQNSKLIDIRSAEEYTIGHLEGSDNQDLMSQHFVKYFSDLNKQTPILLYCNDGTRTKIAVRILAEMGFAQIAELEEGLRNWRGHLINQLTP